MSLRPVMNHTHWEASQWQILGLGWYLHDWRGSSVICYGWFLFLISMGAYVAVALGHQCVQQQQWAAKLKSSCQRRPTEYGERNSWILISQGSSRSHFIPIEQSIWELMSSKGLVLPFASSAPAMQLCLTHSEQWWWSHPACTSASESFRVVPAMQWHLLQFVVDADDLHLFKEKVLHFLPFD